MKTATLKLPADLDITAATHLKELLLSHSETRRLLVDGGDVARVSTPAIQVLAAAIRSAAAEDRSIELKAPSAILTETIDDLGLRDFAICME